MKKFILMILMVVAMIGFTACDDNNNRNQPVQPVQPLPPEPIPPTPEPQPPIEPDPTVPDVPSAGVGSIKGDMDCTGGTITTNYSFGNVSEDDKSFVIQYQRNGALEDLTYPSTSSNGSKALVKDIYYARENDSERDVFWIVTISFQTPDETYNLVTATLRQPKCEETEEGNTTSLTTTYEVK